MMPTHPRPQPPRDRANICDCLSSATDTPRSARQTDLEVILHDLADLKDEPTLSSYEFHIGQLEPICSFRHVAFYFTHNYVYLLVLCER